MAKVGKCQSVIVGNITYSYGMTIPYLRWKATTSAVNEMRNAKIVAVSGIRENTVQFEGKDSKGNVISVNIDMEDVIDTLTD